MPVSHDELVDRHAPPRAALAPAKLQPPLALGAEHRTRRLTTGLNTRTTKAGGSRYVVIDGPPPARQRSETRGPPRSKLREECAACPTVP